LLKAKSANLSRPALELKRAIEQKTPIISSKRGSESNEDFCFRNLRRNNIWRHGSLSQRT
jgi:hypothetical protein